jgi:hypothetical protein
VIVTDPIVEPKTTPPAVILATDGLLLVHVPPGVRSVKVVVFPMQIVDVVPVMTPVGAETVTTVTAEHPVAGVVYEIEATPADSPVTFPEPSTVATPGAPVPQKPPDVPSLRSVVPPVHIRVVPVIGAGAASTKMPTVVAVADVGVPPAHALVAVSVYTPAEASVAGVDCDMPVAVYPPGPDHV